MIGAVVRAALCGLLAACLGAAMLALSYAWHPALDVHFDRELPRLVAGVYPFERDTGTGLTFAWTGAEATIRIPGLDRRVEWTLDLRIRGARPDGRRLSLTFLADGIAIGTQEAPQDFGNVRVTIPARQERRRDAVITMQVSETFTPGPDDTRALGAMIDRLTLTPHGLVLPPRRAFFG